MEEKHEALRVEGHPGVQGLSQLDRNAIDLVIELQEARARDNIAFKQLLAQRDALLDALRRVMRHIPADAGGASLSDDMHRARKAIAQAED